MKNININSLSHLLYRAEWLWWKAETKPFLYSSSNLPAHKQVWNASQAAAFNCTLIFPKTDEAKCNDTTIQF